MIYLFLQKLVRNRKTLPVLLGTVTFVLMASAATAVAFLYYGSSIQKERQETMRKLSLIRARLEGSLNSRLLLARGLVSYVSLHPGISSSEFTAYCRRLIGQDPVIRNVTLLKNTTIINAYPLESNEKAIGIDLATVPDQRDTVIEAMTTGKTLIVGPVNLVQGGQGMISRIPIFTGGSERFPGRGSYWGQASMVIRMDRLLQESGMTDKFLGLNYVLTALDAGAKRGRVIFGDRSILGSDPVAQEIMTPRAIWRIAAIPARGWGGGLVYSILVGAAGIILSAAIGFLIYLMLRSFVKISQLESIFPICSHCKKIRDDSGFWEQVDHYLKSNTDIRFTHSVCPDCAKRLYGEEEWFEEGHKKQ